MARPNTDPTPGTRFEKLLFVERIGVNKYNAGIGLFKCDCGKTTKAFIKDVKSGHTKSCGCFLKLQDGQSFKNAIMRGYVKGAEYRGLSFELSAEDFFNLTQQPCHYCGIDPTQSRPHYGADLKYNGIDRKDNLKGYIDGNVVPCCKICNRAKLNMDYTEFKAWITRLKEKK